ncbi:hypothetical protein HanIR_Chr16g0790531 [Helianthus annuus]|nr:hypothetical protein HanIR_Chr16g0790531 [Helianthus annuus]
MINAVIQLLLSNFVFLIGHYNRNAPSSSCPYKAYRDGIRGIIKPLHAPIMPITYDLTNT